MSEVHHLWNLVSHASSLGLLQIVYVTLNTGNGVDWYICLHMSHGILGGKHLDE
jgi:hypothetical protein